jgi:chromate transporter
LFTFAAYLGAIVRPGPEGILGASIALLGIFLPGILLLMGVLPFWAALRRNRFARAGMAGTNAAVVGILATALYHPLWTSAVLSYTDFAVALAGFVLLTAWKAPPWSVVTTIVASTVILANTVAN